MSEQIREKKEQYPPSPPPPSPLPIIGTKHQPALGKACWSLYHRLSRSNSQQQVLRWPWPVIVLKRIFGQE